MKITYFHRKIIPNFHFSVEIIFKDVRAYLPKDVEYDIVTSKYYSKGFFPRLYNVFQAFFKQGEINHVTGDINYIGIFLNGRRTIHTMLDSVFLINSKGIKKFLLQQFWLKIPARRSRFITTISEASKKEIVAFANCAPDKVKVIPIALSPVFKPVKRDYNWERPRILLIGTAPNKNMARIIEALQGIACTVSMVGKFMPEIKEMLQQRRLEHSYESGLSLEDMYIKYQNSDILVFASTYEGFGMPIMEAQSVGTPVVTSNLSSMPEVAGEGGAVFVDPYEVGSIREGILSIINDEPLRNKLIVQGFSNIKRFDPTHISNMYLELYKQI
jgi:glycosyltransferase involved in cell wall biosynthesis